MPDWFYLSKALSNCSLPESEKENIEARLTVLEQFDDEFSHDEKKALIERIYENQHDRITMGYNYNQTEILKHLKKLK